MPMVNTYMQRTRFPSWLHLTLPERSSVMMSHILQSLRLNTVCRSARCPNITECFAKRRATFLILGTVCTRSCSFCAVDKGQPQTLDSDEPERVANAVQRLGLKHVVITSVTRDDLPDGGAQQFVAAVSAIKARMPCVTVEVLCPDFHGSAEAIDTICRERISVFNHNIETVKRLYAKIRPEAQYERSLELLLYVKKQYPQIITKSGIMVGLGERDQEVFETLDDLRKHQCDVVTLGQYLQPTVHQCLIARFIPPALFETYREYALQLGFRAVYAGPLVRSSYNAGELFDTVDSC